MWLAPQFTASFPCGVISFEIILQRIDPMRMSKLFSQTLRENPSEAEVVSHQLLLRAGYIRSLAAGIFSYLPLARRAMSRIEAIMRQEINGIGGQEVTMPVVNPADIWQESRRWYQIGSELGRFQDKTSHPMVLAMTHEEVIADLVRHEVRSYRQLPCLLYHIQTKWRDDPRPRAGLIRAREFTMLDSYSLDATWDGLDAQYQAHYTAYHNIYRRCELPVVAVSSDTGIMGGKLAHEFMYLNPIGEDTLLICDSCGYSANRQIARFVKPAASQEPPKPLEKVATPHASTIEDLAKFLALPTMRTAKAVFLVADLAAGEVPQEMFIFAVVRGDLEVNESKLTNAISEAGLGSVITIRPATEVEIRAVGAEPGYASPVGLKPAPGKLLVMVDDSIPASPNLVAGANKEGYHLLNTNYGRDYQANIVADIASAEESAGCPQCGMAMRAARGVEVGNIFKLGTRFSDAMDCTFRAEDGEEKPVVMGSYGIGIGRLLACLAEEHHDEKGLRWPASVAPYPAHLVLLAGKSGRAQAQADEIYGRLVENGLEPLYDDRIDSSAGVKFNDADLIGLPLRITVSERSLLQGGLEVKPRKGGETVILSPEEAIARVKQLDEM
jgi:prolyl-tRNA synthetase